MANNREYYNNKIIKDNIWLRGALKEIEEKIINLKESSDNQPEIAELEERAKYLTAEAEKSEEANRDEIQKIEDDHEQEKELFIKENGFFFDHFDLTADEAPSYVEDDIQELEALMSFDVEYVRVDADGKFSKEDIFKVNISCELPIYPEARDPQFSAFVKALALDLTSKNKEIPLFLAEYVCDEAVHFNHGYATDPDEWE